MLKKYLVLIFSMIITTLILTACSNKPTLVNPDAVFVDLTAKPAVDMPAVTVIESNIELPKTINEQFFPVGKVYDVSLDGQPNAIFGENTYAKLTYKFNLKEIKSKGFLPEFMVYYFDALTGYWLPVDYVEVNLETEEVYAYTSHFTPFVLTAAPSADGNIVDAPACLTQDFSSGIGGSGKTKFTIIDKNFRYYQDRNYYITNSSFTNTTFNALGFNQSLGIATGNGASSLGTYEEHKLYTGDDYISFTAHTDIDVYVMYDTRGGTNRADDSKDAPWLASSGFTTNINGQRFFIETTDAVGLYKVYKKSYYKGESVHLHGNRKGVTDPKIQTNYWVILKPKDDTTSTNASSLCVAEPVTNPAYKVKRLKAFPGGTQVTLIWENPVGTDFAGVVVRRSQLAPPATPTAGEEPTGTVVSPTCYKDTSAAINKTYYYSVFALDANNNYGEAISVSTSTSKDSDSDGLSDAFEDSMQYPLWSSNSTAKTNKAVADTNGNGSSDLADIINGNDPTNVDNQKPTVTQFALTSNNPGISRVLFNLNGSDNVNVAFWMITRTNIKPISYNSGWVSSKPNSYDFGSEPNGTYELYAWAMDAAGNVSDAGSSISVLISDRTVTRMEWTKPASLSDNISPDGTHAENAASASNNTGNIITVWQQQDGGTSNGIATSRIYVSLFKNNIWTYPADLTQSVSNSGIIQQAPQVVMDVNGNALVLWQQYDITTRVQSFYFAQYKNGTWSTPVNIGYGTNANISMSENGDAVIVRPFNGKIYLHKYISGVWTHPAGDADYIREGMFAKAAINSNGNIVLVYNKQEMKTIGLPILNPYGGATSGTAQYNLSSFNIYLSEFKVGTWIHDPNPIIPAINGIYYDPVYSISLSMNDSGDAVIAWTQASFSMNASQKYRPYNSLENAALLLAKFLSPSLYYSLQSIFDFLRLYLAIDRINSDVMVYMSHRVNNVWVLPTPVSIRGSFAGNVNCAINANKKAIVTWEQSDGRFNQVYKSEFDGTNWIHPSGFTDKVSHVNSHAYKSHSLIDSKDDIVITWEQRIGSYSSIVVSEKRAGTWWYTDNVNLESGDAFKPRAVMTGNGYSYIFWNQRDASGNLQIFKSKSKKHVYTSGEWLNPVSLSDNISPDGKNTSSPQVAIDSNGNSIIVWSQPDGSGKNQIFKSEYRNGVWNNPSSLSDNISPDGKEALSPQVAMDSNGNAVIVWMQCDIIGTWQVYKSEYRNGLWIHPSSLSDNISPDGQHAQMPQVVMDSSGNAVIVWQQYDLTGTCQIYKSEYRNGLWIHPSSLSDNISPDGQSASSSQVAMDSNGNAIIVWQQYDNNTNMKLFKSEYRNGSWKHPLGLSDYFSPDNAVACYPSVAMDDNLNVIITWMGYDISYTNRVYKSEYRNGIWSHPSSSSDYIKIIIGGRPSVAMDNNGNAIITWSSSGIYKSEYRNGTWIFPTTVFDKINPDVTGAVAPQIAMDSNGNAVIVWQQTDGSGIYQIFKSEYRNEIWTHPTSLSDNISPDGQNAGFSTQVARVALDSNGNAIITWYQEDGSGVYQIFKSEYWVH